MYQYILVASAPSRPPKMYQYILDQKWDIPLKTPKMYQYILDLKWENAQNVPLHLTSLTNKC